METVNLYLHQICLWMFIGLVLCAAWSDFRDYLIPNRISLGLLALYPAYLLSGPEIIGWQMACLIAGAVFLLGIVFFATGLMGGGDVKLMTVCTLWAGPEHALPFLFLTAFAGGTISFAALLRLKYGWIVGFPDSSLASKKVPYGVAIAAGSMYVATRLMAAAG